MTVEGDSMTVEGEYYCRGGTMTRAGGYNCRGGIMTTEGTITIERAP